eukprot:27663-Amphidinium_carterae.2
MSGSAKFYTPSQCYFKPFVTLWLSFFCWHNVAEQPSCLRPLIAALPRHRRPVGTLNPPALSAARYSQSLWLAKST